MRVYKGLIALFLLGFISQAFGGKLTIGAKASIYDPPGVPGPTPMVGGYIGYSISEYLSAEGAVEWSNYDNTTLIPITVNMIYYPLGESGFNPYLGGGSGYYYKKVNKDIESTVGYQLLVGLSWKSAQDFGLSFEVKYIVPDIKNASDRGFSYGGGITGSMTMEL